MSTKVRTFTLPITIPVLTNVEELLGVYAALFDAMGIPQNIPCPPAEGFTHPIESENLNLKMTFMQVMQQLQASKGDYMNLRLVNCNTTQTSVTFVFQYDSE